MRCLEVNMKALIQRTFFWKRRGSSCSSVCSSMALVLGIVTIIPTMTLLHDSICTTFLGGVGLMEYVEVLIFFLCMAATFVFTALSVQSFFKAKNNPAPFQNNYFTTFVTTAI